MTELQFSLLLAFCLFVMHLSLSLQIGKVEKKLRRDLASNPSALQEVGVRYYQKLQAQGSKGLEGSLAHRYEKGDLSALEPLIQLGFQKASGEEQNFEDRIRNLQLKHPSLIYGVKAPMSPTQLLTYQFVHSDWSHLLSNLAYFLIFATALETLIGPLGMLMVFLAGGVAGGLSFSLFTNGGDVLIGASGSISALAGSLLVLYPYKNILFFFFLAPFEGWYRFVHLSKYWILSVLVLPDIAALLSSVEIYSTGVAHIAHLGGFAFGVAFALLFQSLNGKPNAYVKESQV